MNEREWAEKAVRLLVRRCLLTVAAELLLQVRLLRQAE
jgi:hypothetical protein